MPRISGLLLAVFLGKVGILNPLEPSSTRRQCQVGIVMRSLEGVGRNLPKNKGLLGPISPIVCTISPLG